MAFLMMKNKFLEEEGGREGGREEDVLVHGPRFCIETKQHSKYKNTHGKSLTFLFVHLLLY
jgi:hypothetical protein